MAIQLVKGTIYRGRICIAHSNAMISAFSSEAEIRSKLEAQGFAGVQSWKCGASNLPVDWPMDKRADICPQACRCIEATWGRDTGEYPDSGKEWRLADYWVKTPATEPAKVIEQESCFPEGSTCLPVVPPGVTTCCQDTRCEYDAQKKYGVPGLPPDYRCLPKAKLAFPISKVEPSSAPFWIGVGIVGLLAAGGAVAWWLAARSKTRRSRNPGSRYIAYGDPPGFYDDMEDALFPALRWTMYDLKIRYVGAGEKGYFITRKLSEATATRMAYFRVLPTDEVEWWMPIARGDRAVWTMAWKGSADDASEAIVHAFQSYGRKRKNPVRRGSMRVQSLLFHRDKWNVSKAKQWAKSHGFRYGDVDVTSGYVRLRQEDPSRFSFLRTKEFGRGYGIKAVLGR